MTVTKRSNLSRSTKDFYQLSYPYRKNPQTYNTIPVPYVKKEDVSDHKYSLTYLEWLDILEAILAEIKEELLNGVKWNLGNSLGEVQLKKKKCKTFVDRIKSKELGKRVKKVRNEYENYMIIDDWERLSFALPHKWLWRFKSTAALRKEVYTRTDKDYSYIYKFLDK